MSECERCQERLVEWVSDELEGAERRAVADHLADCEVCPTVEAHLRMGMQLAARLGVEDPPDAVTAAVMKAARERCGEDTAATTFSVSMLPLVRKRLGPDALVMVDGGVRSGLDIARMIAAIGAKQVMLVSDSCYSGTLAGRERVQVAQASDAGDLLKRRAAVVMSSGGEEPVADEGRQGHSVFAWHFMQALQGLDQWQIGGSLYERVRAAVLRDFPQTPQYGASRSAGHQGNTDYLFERREFDTPAKP